MQTKNTKQGGFTLVEIAIVLVIIGLLLGGILKGQELINNAKVRSVADRQNSLKAAWFGFIDRYNFIPGDSKRAVQLVPGALHAGRCYRWIGERQFDHWRISGGNAPFDVAPVSCVARNAMAATAKAAAKIPLTTITLPTLKTRWLTNTAALCRSGTMLVSMRSGLLQDNQVRQVDCRFTRVRAFRAIS